MNDSLALFSPFQAGDPAVFYPRPVDRAQHLAALWESRQAILMVVSGRLVGQMFRIDGSLTDIGRDGDCGICLPQENVSRRHARLERDEHNNVLLRDLDSTNGTYVDGVRITRHLLRDGDKVQIGDATILKFSYQDSIEDAIEFREYERAIRDGLTGVYNKMHFMAKLREEFAYAVRRQEPVSVMMLAVDGFRDLLEVFGAEAGDTVLQRLAEVVSRHLRDGDVLARYVREKFTVLQRNQDLRRARLAAERVRRAVQTFQFVWNDQRIPVAVSLGVAAFSEGNFRAPRELLDEADDLLYDARRGGGNRALTA